jgi:hypothetical protein
LARSKEFSHRAKTSRSHRIYRADGIQIPRQRDEEAIWILLSLLHRAIPKTGRKRDGQIETFDVHASGIGWSAGLGTSPARIQRAWKVFLVSLS